MFGKDVALPETKISYRVQSKVGQKTSLQGRDQTYMLPAQSMRVLSLVPADATDIRDTSSATPSATSISARSAPTCSRSSAACCSSSPALMALLALVRLLPALPQAGRRRARG